MEREGGNGDEDEEGADNNLSSKQLELMVEVAVQRTSTTFHQFVPISKLPRNELTPDKYFKLFFDKGTINYITDVLHLYAIQNKRDKTFNTNSDELKYWLKILLLNGYIQAVRLGIILECNSETFIPAIANAMGRNYFELIKSCAHFSDNSNLTKKIFANLQKFVDCWQCYMKGFCPVPF